MEIAQPTDCVLKMLHKFTRVSSVECRVSSGAKKCNVSYERYLMKRGSGANKSAHTSKESLKIIAYLID